MLEYSAAFHFDISYDIAVPQAEVSGLLSILNKASTAVAGASAYSMVGGGGSLPAFGQSWAWSIWSWFLN